MSRRWKSILLTLALPFVVRAVDRPPVRLRCEYLVDPIGVHETRPRLSWIVESSRRGERQTAYEIRVASAPELLAEGREDLWSSGRVASADNSQVAYLGKPLASRQGCWWKVRVKGRAGQFGPWSAPAHWEMGLLRAADWSAQWIASPLSLPSSPGPVPILRRTLDLPVGAVRRARLYASALGLYELRINGERVGDHVLAPDWTDYRKRVQYQAYDVTRMLHPGRNALAALLAAGWYSGTIGLGGQQFYGLAPALLAQLEVVYQDGRVVRVASDGTWTTHASATTASDFMLGEDCDARLEVPGWDLAEGDDSGWLRAVVRTEPPRDLEGQVAEPVRCLQERRPRSVDPRGGGRWIFDLGQNLVGVVRLKVRAAAGTVLTLRHGEVLEPDGSLYVRNLRTAPSVDHYTCRGGGLETWQPRFTFHGFRYVELSGAIQDPGLDTVTAMVLGTDLPAAGTFSCSNPLLNQLQSNIQWGQRGNFLSVPTDCPQRDERLGWMGDAQTFMATATCNADVAAFFTKWLVDVDDGQSPEGRFSDVSPDTTGGGGVPAWGDAGVICPWTFYQAYGDKRVLERHLPAMLRWVDYLRGKSHGLILGEDDRGYDFGDWLAIGSDTSHDLIGAAFFAHSADLTARACRVLGRDRDAERMERLFQELRVLFQAQYQADDGRLTECTQSAYVLALAFDLLPERHRAEAARLLDQDVRDHGWHLTTGFLGVRYLLPVLARAGYLDTAFRLLTQDTFPSWLFSVKQGATTIWERWDGWTSEKGFQDPEMNSFNHYALGSCGQWLFEGVAGLEPGAPGYRHILLNPRAGGGLTHASARLETLRGTLRSAWSLRAGVFTLDCAIPVGCTATVTLPARTLAGVTEGGRPLARAPGIALKAKTPGSVILDVDSGVYRFRCGSRSGSSRSR